jgi:hypothetical protein
VAQAAGATGAGDDAAAAAPCVHHAASASAVRLEQCLQRRNVAHEGETRSRAMSRLRTPVNDPVTEVYTVVWSVHFEVDACRHMVVYI